MSQVDIAIAVAVGTVAAIVIHNHENNHPRKVVTQPQKDGVVYWGDKWIDKRNIEK